MVKYCRGNLRGQSPSFLISFPLSFKEEVLEKII